MRRPVIPERWWFAITVALLLGMFVLGRAIDAYYDRQFNDAVHTVGGK